MNYWVMGGVGCCQNKYFIASNVEWVVNRGLRGEKERTSANLSDDKDLKENKLFYIG
jgi:hypothetical protein